MSDAAEVQAIRDAIQEWSRETCIRFRPRTGADPDWVQFQPSISTCLSYVGRQGQGQIIELAPLCRNVNIELAPTCRNVTIELAPHVEM